jgi:hypothetical protein
MDLPSPEDIFTLNRDVTPLRGVELRDSLKDLDSIRGIEPAQFWRTIDKCECNRYFTKRALQEEHSRICLYWWHHEIPSVTSDGSNALTLASHPSAETNRRLSYSSLESPSTMVSSSSHHLSLSNVLDDFLLCRYKIIPNRLRPGASLLPWLFLHILRCLIHPLPLPWLVIHILRCLIHPQLLPHRLFHDRLAHLQPIRLLQNLIIQQEALIPIKCIQFIMTSYKVFWTVLGLIPLVKVGREWVDFMAFWIMSSCFVKKICLH